MALATLADLSTSLLRDLTAAETTYGPDLLDRAETLLIGLVAQLIDRTADDPAFRASVVSTEADMVARVLRNPSGIVSETEGLYTYRVDLAVSSGRLMPTDDELFHLRRIPRTGTAFGSLDAYARARFRWHDSVHPFKRGG